MTANNEITAENCCGYKGIRRVIVSREEIEAAVKKTGREISEKYQGNPLLIISVLKGAFIFLADLCRAVDIPCEIGFMATESYGDGTVSSGDVKITLDIKQDISKYHVIIAEDIIDTGRTLAKICEILRKRDPLSLEVCTLLDKPSRRETEMTADYALFTIPDVFAVGYGLDCAEQFRNLPFVAEASL